MPTVVALLPAPPAARMCGRKHVQAQLNRTNITGLSVTDSSITWYEFKNRPNLAGGTVSSATRKEVAQHRAPESEREDPRGQSSGSGIGILRPATGVWAWGSGWGSAGDPRGIRYVLRGSEPPECSKTIVFGGDPIRPLYPCIILIKGSHDPQGQATERAVGGETLGLGDRGEEEAGPSRILLRRSL